MIRSKKAKSSSASVCYTSPYRYTHPIIAKSSRIFSIARSNARNKRKVIKMLEACSNIFVAKWKLRRCYFCKLEQSKRSSLNRQMDT